MAYDEYLGERITQILNMKQVSFYSKKMMGGLLFMVNGKMFCGIHQNVLWHTYRQKVWRLPTDGKNWSRCLRTRNQ